MGRLIGSASRRPLLFAMLVVLSSLVMVSLSATLVVVLFGADSSHPILAPVGYLTAALSLLFLLWRLGWLKAAGVATWGRWKGWIAALVLLLYYLLELALSFFGDLSFNVPAAAVSGLRVPTVIIAGAFEEILFRAVVLYALVRVWGTTRRGVLRAVSISAVLFGLVHAVNAIGGDPGEVPGQIAIALFEGIWWAAIVLRWGSVWPAVLIHVATNWTLQTKALAIPDYHGTASSYLLAVLLGLPLAVLGVWWLLRTDLRQQGADPVSISDERRPRVGG